MIMNKYQQEMMEDMKSYSELSRPLKSSFWERHMVHYLPVDKLHANPNDLFTDPSVGPSERIINKYEAEMREYVIGGAKPDFEPIMVEKMSTGGYMIINGHHRWMAARHAGLEIVPVKILNLTSKEEILDNVNRLTNERIVSFDLDEVLFCKPGDDWGRSLSFPWNKLYPQPVRKNTGPLIQEFQRHGFDVWVYTGSYYSRDYIDKLLRHHGARVDGIINDFAHNINNEDVRRTFNDKYKIRVHIDNESFLWVRRGQKDFESFDLPSDKKWAGQAAARLKRMPEIQAERK